jgi:hypothetical protein
VCVIPHTRYGLVLRDVHIEMALFTWALRLACTEVRHGLKQQWARWGPLGDKQYGWGSAVGILSSCVRTETNESNM